MLLISEIMPFHRKQLCGICWIAAGILVAVGAGVSAASIQDDDGDKLAWQQVADQCANFDQSIQTLASYLEFQTNFDKLNKCLHLHDPPQACLEAEHQCRQMGLTYSASKVLGNLVKRASSNEPMCNMEFASRIYRLHKQLVATNGVSSSPPTLARHLRALANRWATHCGKSLIGRLQNIDQRAPDIFKHVSLIANILNSGTSVAEFPLEPEHYVPVLEDERALDETVASAGNGGFTFSTSKQIDTAIQMLKISCKTLKQYHVNLFGSLGLLAKVGFAAVNSGTMLKSRLEKERGLVRAWIASAMICQSMRGVNRMLSVDPEGESRVELLILPLQGPDVSLKAEQDKTFASFGLPEAVEGRMGLELGGSPDDEGDSYVYKEYGRLNARRMELINGPSREMANAIYTYLDLRQQNRKSMATTILNLS